MQYYNTVFRHVSLRSWLLWLWILCSQSIHSTEVFHVLLFQCIAACILCNVYTFVRNVTQLPQSWRQVHDVLSAAESVPLISDSEVTCGPMTRPATLSSSATSSSNSTDFSSSSSSSSNVTRAGHLPPPSTHVPRTLRYDTIRDAILACARKPTWVSYNLPHATDN